MALDLIDKYNQEVLQNRSVFKLAVNKIRTSIRRYLDHNNISYNPYGLWFRYIKIDSEHYALDIIDKSFKKNLINDNIRCNNEYGLSKRGALYHLLGGWYGDFCFFLHYCKKNNLDVDNELINNVIPVSSLGAVSLSLKYSNTARLPEEFRFYSGLAEANLISKNVDIISCHAIPSYRTIHKLLSLFTYILDKNEYPDYIYEFNLIEEE